MKKTITITLSLEQLKYDVYTKTYLTGRSRKNDNNDELVAAMQADDTQADTDQLTRSMENAFMQLKEVVAEYLEPVTGDSATADNTLITDGQSSLVITLKVPGNFNMAVVPTLKQEMHQYVVNMTTGDWMNITDKADAKEYYEDAAANAVTITHVMSERVRPSRPATV